MFLVNLLRFLTGYVYFRGSGGFSERFINLCSVHDIPLWNVTYENGFFTACTTIQGYFKIKRASKNSGVKIRKLKKSGVPFIANRLKPRFGILIGAVFFALTLCALSGKVWRIEINGNTAVPTDVILSSAENAGLQIGVKTNQLNTRQISLDMCKSIDTLSWAAVSVKGNCVYVDITERTQPQKKQTKEGCYNLVSSKDAQLVTLEPYSGTVLAKTYNPVLKGEILISSAVQNKDETVSFSHASGYAVGRTENSFSQTTDTKTAFQKFDLISKTYEINFFGLRIPLGKAPEKYSQSFKKESHLSFKKKVLPIGICVTEFYQISNETKKIPSEIADKISVSSLLNEIYTFSLGKEIIDTKISIDKKTHTAKCDLTCFENIGVEVPVEIEQTP